MHVSSKWHTLYVRAFFLNGRPVNLAAGSYHGVWIRVAVEDVASLC